MEATIQHLSVGIMAVTLYRKVINSDKVIVNNNINVNIYNKKRTVPRNVMTIKSNIKYERDVKRR